MGWLKKLRTKRIWRLTANSEEEMAKRAKSKGRSARNGNAPAPYTKYQKQPFRYSPAYYAWHNTHRAKPRKDDSVRV